MTDSTAYCIAWLRRFAPHSTVLNFYEFPSLRSQDRRRHETRPTLRDFADSATPIPRVRQRAEATASGSSLVAERHPLPQKGSPPGTGPALPSMCPDGALLVPAIPDEVSLPASGEGSSPATRTLRTLALDHARRVETILRSES